jgi:nucleoid-associated protein YgaU
VLLHAQGGESGDDVQDALDSLEALVEPSVSVPDTDQQRPPHVQFVWGDFITPDSVCESVSTTIELFDSTGTPLRAVVGIRLKQVKPELSELGDGGGLGRELSHLVQAGETLAHVAHAVYGDVTRWKSIAEANHIDDPLKVAAGFILKIPLGRL